MALPSGLPQIGDLGSLLGSLQNDLVSVPLIAVPFTTIQNRAQMYDLSKDLGVRFGVDRFQAQQLYQIVSEAGPNGQAVWGVQNDYMGAVRLVGERWDKDSATDSNGNKLQSNQVGDYVEISWYGTGLNILIHANAAAQTLVANIDGGSDVTVHNTSYQNTLNNRFYVQNTRVQVASGLTLGLHTAKIRLSAGVFFIFSGYEAVCNSGNNVVVNPGTSWKNGQKRYNATQTLLPYNSGFASGTLGSRGGQVLVYQNSDGGIAHAVMPTNSSTGYFSNADHTNEEVIRSHSFLEFGNERSDDWDNYMGSPSNRAFTLDDNVTTLVAQGAAVGSDLGVGTNASGDFIDFTWVGTGLDMMQDETPGSFTGTQQIYVDGVLQFSGNLGTIINKGKWKIVSGLPYGTHTMRYIKTAGGSGLSFKQLITYGPKKPTIPSDAIPLARYFVNATHTTNAVFGTGIVSPGTIRNQNVREIVYFGAANPIGLAPVVPSGWQIALASATTDYAEYQFYGTGFQLNLGGTSSGATTSTLTVDGVANLSALTTGSFGTLTYTASTGNVSVPTNGGGVVHVNGLTLGMHKVRITKTSGAFNLYVDQLDAVTPIHAPKEVGPVVLNPTLAVGSCSITDLRKTKDTVNVKKVSKAFGFSATPTTTIADVQPIRGLSTILKKERAGRVRISYSLSSYTTVSSAHNWQIAIYMNGKQVGGFKQTNLINLPNSAIPGSDTQTIELPPGDYKFDVFWYVTSNNAILAGTRNLTVEEID